MASLFDEEPITVRRAVSATLLRETRTPTSVRPTTPIPAAPWPVEDPVVRVVETWEPNVDLDADEPEPAANFDVREVNASRGYDPRSE